MYLKKISLENFRCFEKVEADLQKKLTLVVGANGAGKTSLLESIAIAMSTMFTAFDGAKAMNITKESAHLKAYKIGSTDNVQPQYPVRIGAWAQLDERPEIYWERTLNTAKGKTTIKDAKQILEVASDYQKRLQEGDTSLLLPIIAYYGTGRQWDYHREKQADISEKNTRTNGYIDCMSGTANIKLMMNWFLKMTVQKYQNQENGYGPVPELEAVFSAMEQCCNRITGSNDAKIQYNIETKEIDVAYTDAQGMRMCIPLNQLSDGYKSTISLVADIAYRMAVLNPQCLGEVCKKTDGIILIDEVDLHLHPAWQKQLLHDLTEIFPNVQFVVSTNAPEVINSVAREQVVVLENYQALPAPAETYGKDANSILRAIMRVKERPDDIMEKFEQFYHAIDAQEYTLANEIIGNLDEILGDDPDLTAMHIQLDLEQM